VSVEVKQEAVCVKCVAHVNQLSSGFWWAFWCSFTTIEVRGS